MFIDTHCHLTDDYCDAVSTVIERAKSNDVGVIICPTANPSDISGAIKIANSFDNIFCTIGIHPEYAGVNPNDFLTSDILNNAKVLGIGEIGLDYHERDDNKSEQIELFERQLDIATDYNLPVAIHTRDAEQDTANILTNKYHGVMHCFTSSWDLAKIMLNRGFYFSASGILTFKNAESVRETFSKIPLDRIVIETDSPYCAPVPYRGKKCEPYMVVETARVLAQIKNISINELSKTLYKNVKNLYPKIDLF